MSYKSDFYGREIDTQIKYVKESLPTIIENIVKNIETLSKNKAEKSTVPSKTSQITNDSGYITGKTLEEELSITTEDIINTLRTEHVEHLWGSEIDAKYKVGEYIPSLMLYESGHNHYENGDGELYKNAPFEGDGIIISHSCKAIGGDFDYHLTYQFAISYKGELVQRTCTDGELFSDVAWTDNLIPTKLSQLEDDIGFKDVKDMYDTLMGAGCDAETIISAGESAFEACQIANENVERITSIETNLNAGSLKGSVSDSFVSLGDVSPVPHTVKTNVHSKNLFNINDVYKATYTDYRVEDNKLILKKTNPNTNFYSNIFFTIGKCKDFSNKTLTVSITNESSNIFSTHFVHAKDGTVYANEPICRLGSVGANKTTVITGTIPENDMDEILCLRIVSQNTTVTDEEYTLSNIQVEYGTQATPYKPYVNVEDTTVKVCGANLFDVHNAEWGSANNRAGAEVLEDGTVRVTRVKKTGYEAVSTIMLNTSDFVDKYLYAKADAKGSMSLGRAGIYFGYVNTTSGATQNATGSAQDMSTTLQHLETYIKPTTTNAEKYDKIRLVLYINASENVVGEVGDYADYSNIMISTSDVPYEPYEGETYTPDEGGKIEINSMSPIINISSDTPNVVINAEYNRDINKAFAELQAMILGG